MIKMLLVLFLILCASEARAQSNDGKLTHIAIGSYIAASGADLSTTMYVTGARLGHEINPVFAPFIDKPFAAGTFKMGLAAVTSYALLRMHETHPKLAFWLSVAGSVTLNSIAIHNGKLI